MPSFTWLYADDTAHDRKVAAFLAKYDTNHDGRVTKSELDKNGDGVVTPDELPPDWKELDVWPVNPDGTVGDGIVDMHDYGPVPTREMQAVEAYLQKIGTAIGDWRVWEPWPTNHRPAPTEPLALRLARGKEVFEKKCAGCHGKFGNGRLTKDDKVSSNFNDAYHFLDPQPRNFTLAAFKSRTTPSGALPRDEDLFRTITRGIRKGQIMPAWGNAADGHTLSEQDRWDLVDYVKTFSDRFQKEEVPPPIDIPVSSLPGRAGRAGRTGPRGQARVPGPPVLDLPRDGGKGDGPSANALVDDFEVPILPFDFTTGNFKFGDSPADVYRTFNTGLNGTPMPSFYDTILYPKEAFPDLKPWQQIYNGKPVFSEADVAEIGEYIAKLPTAAELGKMSEPDRAAFADHRRWALVYFALSLGPEPGRSRGTVDRPASALRSSGGLDGRPLLSPRGADLHGLCRAGPSRPSGLARAATVPGPPPRRGARDGRTGSTGRWPRTGFFCWHGWVPGSPSFSESPSRRADGWPAPSFWIAYGLLNLGLASLLVRFTAGYGDLPEGPSRDRLFVRFLSGGHRSAGGHGLRVCRALSDHGSRLPSEVPGLTAVQEGI